LHWGASYNAPLEIFYLILQRGLDYDVRDRKGLSPASIAQSRGYYKTAVELNGMRNHSCKAARFLA
jgi:hypothetical protein